MIRNSKLKITLIDLGLTEKEAAVYLSALSLGPCKAADIAKDSGIKRTTVYSVVDQLKEAGLMFTEHHGFKQFFVAEHPSKLESILKRKKIKFDESFPVLEALYNVQGRDTTIRIHEGLEAIKTVYESFIQDIKPGEDYMVISEMEHWYDLDPKYFSNFLKRRSKLNINTRMLLQDTKTSHRFKKIEKNLNEKIKILPKKSTLMINLVVTPQRAMIHQLESPIVAFVVENKSVVKMYQQFFELMWESLESA